MRRSLAAFFTLSVFTLFSFSASQGSSPRQSQQGTSTASIAEASGYTIREINWTGIEAIPFAEIAAVSKIQAQDVLATGSVQATLQGLLNLYESRGYAQVSVLPRFEVHEAGHWVAVYFTIREGTLAKPSLQHQ